VRIEVVVGFTPKFKYGGVATHTFGLEGVDESPVYVLPLFVKLSTAVSVGVGATFSKSSTRTVLDAASNDTTSV
jgi:hypothetical protein